MTWEQFLGDKQVADVILREAIGENPVVGLEQYGIKNPTDAQIERAAVMEQNGASEEEIRATLQDMGESGGKLFSRTEEEIAKDEEVKRQFKANIKPLLQESKKKNHKNESTSFGKAKPWLVVTSERNGLDVNGFKHSIDVDGLVHINDRHGADNEMVEGQKPVTDEDIENIPDIVNTPDYLVYGKKTTKGKDTIGYIKTVGDDTTYYVEEVRTGKETLSAKTMYKVEGVLSSDFVNQKLRSTSKTPPSAITYVPAFVNLGQGTTEVKQINENGKLFSRNQGAYTPVSRIIELARERTPDTFLHEVSHNFFINYFDAIERIADKNSAYVKQAQAVYDLVGKKSSAEFFC